MRGTDIKGYLEQQHPVYWVIGQSQQLQYNATRKNKISSIFENYKRGHESLSAPWFYQFVYLKFGTSAKLSQLLKELKSVTTLIIEQLKPFSSMKSYRINVYIYSALTPPPQKKGEDCNSFKEYAANF